MRNIMIAAFFAFVLIAGHAMAQTSHENHMAMPTVSPGSASPEQKAFEEANRKMHKGMAISYTGDADTDFVKGMIPHHQGAVDMAKIVLQYGKDPEIKKLAEGIVKAQNEEIAFMNAWLAKKATDKTK
jgi:uncharacterized protein (DUF305 family)